MKILILLLISMDVFAATANTLSGNNLLPTPTKQEIERSAEKIKIPSGVKISDSWLPYLNPAFEEFWTEGNHRPDAGFVLFARNPSVDNAKLWLLRMETKAKYLEVMFDSIAKAQQELIKSGILKDRYGVLAKAKSLPTPAIKQTLNKEGMAEIEIFFLFSSSCSHCKKLASTLKGFSNVSPLQVDETKSLFHFEGLPSSELATDSTKNEYLASGEVPVLVLHDPKTKTVNILKGNRPQEEILLAMASLINNRGENK